MDTSISDDDILDVQDDKFAQKFQEKWKSMDNVLENINVTVDKSLLV